MQKILNSKEVIKIRSTVLSKDKKKAATGYYVTKDTFDLCEPCYDYLMSELIQRG